MLPAGRTNRRASRRKSPRKALLSGAFASDRAEYGADYLVIAMRFAWFPAYAPVTRTVSTPAS
ncbi:hypothetical protein MAH_4318 [Mycobacterium avium subsp. hominissuis TH135]|nr:hypothetical protein MAH_4318 [Mycobacterium avium subsp. hominissuis TH135]